MEKQHIEAGMTPQENVHRIITEWKKSRAEDEKEAAEKFNSPKYQEIFKNLEEKNEERRKAIDGK